MMVYYTVHGQGKPLVLFHGWGFDSNVWGSIVGQLSQFFQVYLVDLPGFGWTPHQPWDVFKATLFAELPTPFALMGWSMGGVLATRLALESPTHVTQVLNITSSPCFVKRANWPGIDPLIFQMFYSDLLTQTEQTLARFIQLQSPRSLELSLLPKQSPTAVGLQSGLDWLAQCDLREALMQHRVPVGYVFGRLDALVPRTTLVALQRSHPHLHCVMLPKAAHMPFISHPDEFLETVLDFFK